MPPPVITLTTDFGLADEYAGVMKGVLLSRCPGVQIVDITHQIEPQDILQAAFTVEAAYPYFPKGAVHVVVVDPGVGSRRRILAAAARGHFFVGPDNGVFWPILGEAEVDALVSVTESAFFLTPVSATFHGRDIFAPVAAALARGTPLAALGPPVAQASLQRLEIPVPRRDRGKTLLGCVIGLDRFGNLITNIRREHLDAFAGRRSGGDFFVEIKQYRIHGISDTYASAGQGRVLALFGSRGQLEIALCGGNAARWLGAERDTPVRVGVKEVRTTPGTRKTPPKRESDRKDTRRRTPR